MGSAAEYNLVASSKNSPYVEADGLRKQWAMQDAQDNLARGIAEQNPAVAAGLRGAAAATPPQQGSELTVAPPAAPAPPPMDQQALVAYLLSRGYSSDLAPKLAVNMIANPTYGGNAEMIQAASKAHVSAWAADKLAQAGTQPGDAGGTGAQAIASHFQRQGYSPEEAITLAYHAVGAPTAQTPPLAQVGGHPPLAKNTITSEQPTVPAPTLSDAEVKRLRAYAAALPANNKDKQGKLDKLSKVVSEEYPDADSPEIEMKEGE